MSHDYANLFLKLQIEEDAMLKQLSYGNINHPYWISQLHQMFKLSSGIKENERDEDFQQSFNQSEDSINEQTQLPRDQESFQLHIHQLNELRIQINERQLKAYSEHVKRYRKCEKLWIRLYQNKKQQEEAKRAKQMEKKVRRLDQKRQFKEKVEYVINKMSSKLSLSKIRLGRLFKHCFADKSMSEDEKRGNEAENTEKGFRLEEEGDLLKATDLSTMTKLKSLTHFRTFHCFHNKPIQLSLIKQEFIYLLHLNYRRWMNIKWQRTKVLLRAKVKLIRKAAQLVVFKLYIYKIKVIKRWPIVLRWIKRKRFTLHKIRLRLRKSIKDLLHNKEHTTDDTINGLKENDTSWLSDPVDHFMQAHQALLKFQIYKLHLLCQYRIQFTLLAI